MVVKPTVCLTLILLCLSFFSQVRAEKIHRLEPIIVSADRLSQPAAKSTSSVTVITQEELTKQSPVRADEILRGTPGLAVKNAGTMGESVSIRLRGSNSCQTLVLIDGMKVNSPWDGSYGEWGNTELADIERIEVIRGTQSELYGSEAMGGVIQLFTKEGKGKPGASIFLGGGSFETFRESLEFSGDSKNLDYFFSATQTISNGQFDNDGYRNTSLSTQIGWQASQAFSLKAVCRYQDAKKELAVNPDEFFSLDPAEHTQTFFWDKEGVQTDRLSLNNLIAEGDPYEWWHYRLNIGSLHDHSRTRQELYYNTTNLSISDIISNRFRLATQHDFFWPDQINTLSLGLEYEWEAVDGSLEFTGDPNTIIQIPLFNAIERSRHNISLFFQDRTEVHPLTLTAGLRRDNNSTYESVWSPRVSGALDLDQTKTLFKASWAQGFRAPTFQELYFPMMGNPDLKPEKNSSFELGVNQPLGAKLFIGCTYFHNKFKNLISKTGDGAHNIGAATTEGIEAELAYQALPQLGFQVYYTYLDSEDEEKHHELPNRPHHTWKITADYSQGRFCVQPVIYLVSSEYNDYKSLDLHGNPPKTRTPGYSQVDISLKYASRSRWQWYARVNNLFDEDHYEAQGFPLPGLNFLTGVTGTF